MDNSAAFLAKLPHQPPMRLIDRVVSVDGNIAVAETIVKDSSFLGGHETAFPAYWSLEMMAQTAALVVVQAIVSKDELLSGQLIQCRQWVSHQPDLPVDEPLTITVEKEAGDALGMLLFSGYLTLSGKKEKRLTEATFALMVNSESKHG